MTSLARISLLISALVLPAACTTDPATTDAASRAILQQPCANDTECPADFECEVEVEHGTTTSFCQAHDVSSECPAGFEREVEHGQAFCKPHGGAEAGDDNGGDAGDENGSGSGSGGTGAACTSNADCPTGQECETEIEHGQTVKSCKPHGGV